MPGDFSRGLMWMAPGRVIGEDRPGVSTATGWRQGTSWRRVRWLLSLVNHLTAEPGLLDGDSLHFVHRTSQDIAIDDDQVR